MGPMPKRSSQELDKINLETRGRRDLWKEVHDKASLAADCLRSKVSIVAVGS